MLRNNLSSLIVLYNHHSALKNLKIGNYIDVHEMKTDKCAIYMIKYFIIK